MYIEMKLLEHFRAKFGMSIGTHMAYFFEEWRNYGQEYVMKLYPERTCYEYIKKLKEAGFLIKLCKGKYEPVTKYDIIAMYEKKAYKNEIISD